MSKLITNYKNFDYKNEFIPTSYIFNLNTGSIKNNVGVGVFQPTNIIDISKETQFKGNITMNGNIYLKKNTSNLNEGFIKVLFYNKLLKSVDVGTLQYSAPYKSNIGFTKTTDSLTLEPLDNKTNTSIFHTFKFNSSSSSLEYNNIKKTLTFDLISNSKLLINHISIHKNTDKTPYTTNIDFNTVKSNSFTNIPVTNNSTGFYTINNSYTLDTNIFSKFNLNNIESDLNVEIIANYDYNAGSYWYNTTNSNKYINKTVGIHKNNQDCDLYVLGNTHVSNDLVMISSNINNVVNKSLIQTKMNLNVDNIQSSNTLFINSNNTYIGSTRNDDILCVIGNSSINYKGDLTIQDLSIKNNLNISSIKKSYNSIDFNTTNTKIKSTYYTNNQIDSNDINNIIPYIPKTLIKVDNSHTYLNSKVILNNSFDNITTNHFSLYVNNYDVKADNIDYKNILYNNINANNTTNSNISNLITTTMNIKGMADINRLKTKTIEIDEFYSNYIDFTNVVEDKKQEPGVIYKKNSDYYLNYKDRQYKLQKFLNDTNSIENNINNNSLKIKKTYITDLDSKTINTNKLTLPKNGLLPHFNYSTSIGSLSVKNNIFTLHDGSNESKLLFNEINDFYKIEFRYNKIKTEEQFNDMFVDVNAKYKITINQNNATIIYISNNNQVLQKTNLFYIRNNKVITDNNENTFFTLFNIKQINPTTYTSNIQFDKKFDNNDLIYVHIIPYNFSNKIYKITKLPINEEYLTIDISLATSTDLDIHKYKIINFQIYTHYNVPLPIYVYNIVDYTTYLRATLVYKTEIVNVASTINYIINNQNLQKYGYKMDYLNHNSIYKIKNKKIFTTLDIDTNLRLTNKRLLQTNTYEAYIGNSYIYS